jgi:hypothetical protein
MKGVPIMSFRNWIAGLEWLVDAFVQYLYRTVEIKVTICFDSCSFITTLETRIFIDDKNTNRAARTFEC